jgi:hypothetical protein
MDLFINDETDDVVEVVTMSTSSVNDVKIEIRSSFLRGNNIHTKKLTGMEERTKAYTDIFSKSIFVISSNEYNLIYDDLQNKGNIVQTRRLNILMNVYFIYCCYIKHEIAFSFEISNIFNEEINFKRSSDTLRDLYMNDILGVLGVTNIRYRSCPIKYYIRGLLTLLRKRALTHGFEVTPEDNTFLTSKTSQLYIIQEKFYDLFLTVMLIGIKHNGFASNECERLFDVCLYNVMLLVREKGEDIMPVQYQEDIFNMIDSRKGFNKMYNLTRIIQKEKSNYETNLNHTDISITHDTESCIDKLYVE